MRVLSPPSNRHPDDGVICPQEVGEFAKPVIRLGPSPTNTPLKPFSRGVLATWWWWNCVFAKSAMRANPFHIIPVYELLCPSPLTFFVLSISISSYESDECSATSEGNPRGWGRVGVWKKGYATTTIKRTSKNIREEIQWIKYHTFPSNCNLERFI